MLLDLDGLVKVSDNLDREYMAVVVSNNDPKKLSRVKCSIEGLLEGAEADLPFAHSKLNPDISFVPKVGDKLRVVFRGGDIYMPEYVGYWRTTENKNAEFDTNYPDSIGIARDGFKIKYNNNTKLFEVQFPNGSKFTINNDGDIHFTATKDFIVDADGKITLNSTGDLTISSDGTAIFKGTGGTTVGDSGSVTNVNGTTVLLAGGGLPVALLGSISIGTGNMGAPVLSQIISNCSSKVLAAP